MRSLRPIAAAFAGVAVLVESSLAHSTSRNPVTYVTLIDDPLLHTSSHHVHAYSTFDLTFRLHDGREKVRLALEPNHDVIHDSLEVTYMNPDGSVRSVEPVDRAHHKVFKGKAFVQRPGHSEWCNAGWARITVHRDGKKPVFEGAFRIDGNHHHIHTMANYRKLKHADDPKVDAETTGKDRMVVWRDSDVVEEYRVPGELKKREPYGMSSCGSDALNYNAEFTPIELRDTSSLNAMPANALFGRQIDGTAGTGGAGVNLVSNIGSTDGCPNTRKVALVGIAADCTYRSDFDSDEETRKNIIQQVNAASEVYEDTFNISLGIQNLTIVAAACPATPPDTTPWNVDCNSGVDISERLSLFSEWRGRSRDSNAFWTLLSTCNTDSAVGLAWLGQVCQQGSQTNSVQGGNETISSANVVIRTQTEWQVIAHEVGHTFGAVHDCTGDACAQDLDAMQKCCPFSRNDCDADGQFIMNPSTGRGITAFSPCSIGNICAAVGRSANQCLMNNKDVQTITGSQCGNGIVEAGEQCDCGGEQGCVDNDCCDSETCMFKDNAVCDPANEDCCTDSCQFSAAGTVCRASSGVCDPEEVCPGDKSMCPEDTHQDDGTDCGEDGQGLQCASGQCTSRDQQCRAMMGGLTQNSEETFACESQGCVLSCSSPQFQPGQCIVLNQNFLDGTPCQGGGTCSNGQCAGASIPNEISSWIQDNKNIVIPVASVIGGIIVLAMGCCIFSSVKKRMSNRKRRKAAAKQSPINSWTSYGGSFSPGGNVPPPQQTGMAESRRSLPRQPTQPPQQPQNGVQMPQGPPPTYTPYQAYQPQWGYQGRSMRYA